MSRSRGLLRRSALLAALAFGCRDPRPPPGSAGHQESTSVPATSLDSLMAAGDSLHGAGDYPGAKLAWTAGLGRIQAGRDLDAEGRILTSLGLSEWRLGDYATAWEHAEQARALLEANDLRPLLPRTYNALGLIAWDQGRLSEAAELWRQTMAVAREVGDQEYVAKPAMNRKAR